MLILKNLKLENIYTIFMFLIREYLFMNKLFAGFFVLLLASSNSFAATPYLYDHCGVLGFGGDSSNVKGDRYVLVGSTETYRHEGELLNGSGLLLDGRTAYFSSLDGDAGSDEYSYQDFKQVAKRNIYFPNRGSNYVQIDYSFKDPDLAGNIIYVTICKNINVQSVPTISKKILSENSKVVYAEVNSTYDNTYSKAAIEGVGVTYVWYLSNLSYPSSTSYRQETSTPYATFYVRDGGNYNVRASINDGVHSKSVSLGDVYVQGNPPCNPHCYNPTD
ncbi:hypothetical protein [Microbulbifer sp. TYP-18]|uniref:hypothetical protein n=1 Tax=Microbulbifer sp. TYP-18 TaxID=3230024 RepID=UPI0034C62955